MRSHHRELSLADKRVNNLLVHIKGRYCEMLIIFLRVFGQSTLSVTRGSLGSSPR